ncbi:hypothetical protein PBRA_000880 [Plasmodiophora brassicae]|uniref:DNA polymerase n=1 Tax=Plasmodiophora brassicae TaxID=37360 RepID=A0A0G4IQU4_PLABS|nr:hypothetical protein PBRA_000880 [Plasmodiophora brassicae]
MATTRFDDINHVDRTRLFAQWARPTPSAGTLDFARNDMDFQVIDTTTAAGLVPGWLQKPGRQQSGPIVRLFGVTKDGHSVLVNCHGFHPYLFVKAWDGYSPADAGAFAQAINRSIGSSNGCVLSVESVDKQSIWGYSSREEATHYLRLNLSSQSVVTSVRRVLEEGLRYQERSLSFVTYESKILFELRFMIDTEIVGGGWVRLPMGTYRHVKDSISTCQMEVDTYFDTISAMAIDDPEWLGLAPLRILSFDIECAGRKDTFPDPELDPVIQIASTMKVQGSDKPLINTVFTLGSCSAIAGADVVEFTSENELLGAWQEFIQATDPDILVGYNIINFDLPYLLNRARTLKCPKFAFLSRTRNTPTRIKESTFSSKAFGTHESKDMNIDGRIQFDVFQIVQREYKLSSYSLNAVSAHFLRQQKEDVHHSIITDLFNGTSETRRRLAVYCLKDALLPLKLCDSLLLLINHIEMARVTGVPISFLLTRGQQIKVVSQLYRQAKKHGYVIPNRPRVEGDVTYEGATVLEPRKGFYTLPIATLDFSSLYPSIMIAHNFCYSTLVPPSQVQGLAEGDYVRSPTGDVFVKRSVKEGLLPRILKDLISARSRAKKDMASATDSFLKQVLNGRQLALKISANSVYGFTGATVGSLPCLEISSSVTAFGRQMIEESKIIVEREFTVEKGFRHNAEVIYGDTDSVFVQFGVETVEEAMELGKKAADLVTKEFEKPISLEFEKVYKPLLLMNKKRYAGLHWTNPVKWSKMDVKGLETVRRDNCPMVQTVLSTCLNKILVDSDVQGALDYAKQTIGDLLTNNIDMSQLVLTKQLGKDPMKEGQYTGKQAHVELARRMHNRDPSSAPQVGDRVAYVIIKGAKNAKAHEKAEDPIWVLEHGIPIDAQHYLDHQLKLPLGRLFEPIVGSVDKLLTGDHMRSVKISTPSKVLGGMMKFTVVRETCMGCKTPLSNNERAVCQHCAPRLPALIDQHVQNHREAEALFARLWTQCQRCQGSLHQDVLCSSRDCPIFYRRKKAQKDLMDTRATLERFNF